MAYGKMGVEKEIQNTSVTQSQYLDQESGLLVASSSRHMCLLNDDDNIMLLERRAALLSMLLLLLMVWCWWWYCGVVAAQNIERRITHPLYKSYKTGRATMPTPTTSTTQHKE